MDDRKTGGRGPFRTGMVATIASAHFIHDIFTAFPAPLLPLIIENLGLTLFQAGSLIVFLQIPSFFNPLIGSLVDRGSFHRLLVIVTPALTGTLICLIGLAPSYGVLAVVLLTAGISVALIHVASPVMVGTLSGDRIGRGMSFFMFGGEMARTVGPLVAVRVVTDFGLTGIWRMIPVAVASSLILWWRLSRAPAPRPAAKPAGLLTVWKRMRAVLTAVTGIIIARAFMFNALSTFLPTYIYGEGAGLWIANISLSIMELGGAAGAFVTGTLSDRLGRRRILLIVVTISPLLMLLFLFTGGPLRMVVLLFLGFALISTTPVLLAIVIEKGGSNQAAATGTFMMVTFAARSLIMLVVGALGDALGLYLSYFICAGFATLGIPFVLMLPKRASSAL